MYDKQQPEILSSEIDQRSTPTARFENIGQHLDETLVTTLQMALADGKLDQVDMSESERSTITEGKLGQLSFRRMLWILCHLPAFEIVLQNDATTTFISAAPYITSRIPPRPRKKYERRRPVRSPMD